ncbi:unnamed protein product [Cuscuta europaea]|uniref:non-specific serine/threonine protein kinase n=1 Tax=Cuscuta europaea TaxID=41803 RepID=A0A9P0YZW6_CUSEU|nr:unnamed protein product [Cuscuta europaea]
MRDGRLGNELSMKMNCFSCCLSGEEDEKLSKKSIQQCKDMRLLASFANISLKSDRSRKKYIEEEVAKFGKGKNNSSSSSSARAFTYQQLVVATQNFNLHSLLGEGGFGRVYKGHLHTTNKDVAVKKLDRNGLQGNREFLVEVLLLSLLHHPNLVSLQGYCCDGDQRLLVYEFMSNGSLEDHLLDRKGGEKALDWMTRMRIAQGAARGLEYLHETAKPPVIYRDFKASNILLDDEFNAKLSDFGLAKLGPTGEQSHVTTRVMGTYGYCAPEYASTGQLTTKSDVYSFGVVFLEILTGRRVIDNSRPSEEQNLVLWAQPLFKDKKKFHMIADPLLEGNYPAKGLHQALAIAAMCLQEEADTRPFISDVVSALEFLCGSRSSSGDDDEDEDAAAGHEDNATDVATSSPPQ